jgi:hypothetical protein
LLAGAQSDGLKDVALACARLAGDDEILGAPYEIAGRELHDGGAIERRLEVPVERLERFALAQTARDDAPLDPVLAPQGGLLAEDAIDERGRGGPLTHGPFEMLVEMREGVRQPEDFEVPSDALDDVGVGAGDGGLRLGVDGS